MKRVLGVVVLLFGVALLSWIAYNFLIEMQPEARGRNPILPLGFSLAMIYVGVTWIRGGAA